ncbi:MAG: sensor histidine kinase [Methanospirillum sp.]|uniref:sensor histidine kinase n=1 Tax=Methanospirillum sp. TaxID=45200 RepID=UPI00236BEB00|nr:sensor histidine kinase [Methanospirillum sp.]MDD1729731.1 sensor histidine kinase [Methanospirillum sp.]
MNPNSPIRIGVIANRGEEIALQEWGPTAEYLSKILAPLKFIIVPYGYNETITAVKKKEVSFISSNPSICTNLEYYGLVQRIASLQVPGDPNPESLFGGVIFTRSDRSDINTLSDLKGKRFIAVDPESLGGWQAVLGEFLSVGIYPDKDFASLNFTGVQDAVVYAVITGQEDAGSVRSTQLERMNKEGLINLKEIKVLHNQNERNPGYLYLLSTSLYPEWSFASVSGVDQELSKKVAVALLMMKSDDPATLAMNGAGWTVPQDHTTVHNLLRRLNLPPYENYGKPTVQEVFNQYWQTIFGIIAGIIMLSILLSYTWKTKNNLNRALKQVREDEITLRNSHDELEIAKNKAEISDRLKSAFLATMSHELRTPLNSIIGFVGILLMDLAGPLNTEQKKQLGMVQHSAEHLLALINDVLDISKIESGELKIANEPVEIIPSVKSVVTALQPLASKKGITIEMNLDPQTGMVSGDKRRIEQIVMNLLSNAIKFTDMGTITLNTQVTSDEVVLSVRDTGIGIREEDLNILFQPFRQVDSGTTRKQEGTGLGLSICKKLVGLHGGRITVESKIGEGSSFMVFLPIMIPR